MFYAQFINAFSPFEKKHNNYRLRCENFREEPIAELPECSNSEKKSVRPFLNLILEMKNRSISKVQNL